MAGQTASEDRTEASANRADAKPAGFQIGLTRGLVLSFGGLVLLAVVAVLALGFSSARQNTLDLLRDKSEATIQLIVDRIGQHLRPVEDQLDHLGRRIDNREIDLGDDEDLGKALAGALAATPQVRSAVFVHADARMVLALRRDDGVDVRVVDVSGMPEIVGAMRAAGERTALYWGELVHAETAEATLVNVRNPVYRAGVYMGTLAATVRTGRLSELLAETAETLGGNAFILYGGSAVLAHPKLIDGYEAASAEHPLPTVGEVGDAVLAAYLAEDAATGARAVLETRTGIRILDVGGESYALLARELNRYGDVPWLAGVYFPAAGITEELRRLQWAAIAGVVVLVIALAAAYGIARYLSAPLYRLAGAAQQVRDLTLDRVPRLPRSVFAELTEAAQAFNAMVVGLRWFETYVPRTLVHQLVRHGGGEVESSVAREATVMFTDIVAFTRQSEAMTAPQTAEFLNRHFAMLSACVEAEGGTIDKFIGDAVMAFWGAPEPQADHAAHACRAALAIRDALGADNRVQVREGHDPVRVRIGIHSGEVIVGNIGAPGRINYTIVGDTVNIANRLEQLGKEMDEDDSGTVILASAATTSAAGIEARALGAHKVRGRQEEIEVFAL